MKKYTKKEVLEQGISFKPMPAYQIIKLCKHFGFDPNEISYDKKAYWRFYSINGRIYYGHTPNSYLKHPDSSLRSKIEISFEEFDFEDENKEIKIEIPEGYEIDEGKSTFEKIIFKPIVDFSILNTEDWFYVKTHNDYIAKGHIATAGLIKCVDICHGIKYLNNNGLSAKEYIKKLRLATKEEIDKYAKPAFPEEFNPRWEDFGRIEGYCLDEVGYIIEYINPRTHNNNRNTWPTKEEAEACLALSQLCQWRDKYNEGWKADWSDSNTKYNIIILGHKIMGVESIYLQNILNFKTSKIRDKFIEDFRDLIEIAKPLL